MGELRKCVYPKMNHVYESQRNVEKQLPICTVNPAIIGQDRVAGEMAGKGDTQLQPDSNTMATHFVLIVHTRIEWPFEPEVTRVPSSEKGIKLKLE